MRATAASTGTEGGHTPMTWTSPRSTCGGEMARPRPDQQHLGLRPPRRALEDPLEMQQAAERALPDRIDVDRNPLAADHGGVDCPFRLAVAARRALEQFARCGHRFAERGIGQRIDRALEIDLCRIRECA